MFRRRLAALLLPFLLIGCATQEPSSVEPGDGPAASESYEGPVEGEPADASEPPTRVAGFHDKYTYEDGLQVEVIRIQRGHFTAKQVEYGFDDEKKDDPYVKFTLRVKNGSKQTVELSASATVVYGPDGAEAVKSSLLDDDSGLDGKLIPGKSRSAVAVYLIPEKYWDDVVMEVTTDYEHDSVVFSGSVK